MKYHVVVYDSFDREYAIGFPSATFDDLEEAIEKAKQLNEERFGDMGGFHCDHFDVFNEDYSERLACTS